MIIEKVDGVSDCMCNGEHWFVIHFEDDLCFYGQHEGQVTTHGEIEYYNTEAAMYVRIIELGLVDAEEMQVRIEELELA